MLRDYATSVITVEWRTWSRAQHFRRVALLPEILARTNELLKRSGGAAYYATFHDRADDGRFRDEGRNVLILPPFAETTSLM